MKKGQVLKFMFYFTGAMVIFTQNCYAYIDPASTSYIIQIIAGILIACGTAIGIGWNKFKRKFKKKDGETAAPELQKKSDDGKKVITADDLLDDEE